MAQQRKSVLKGISEIGAVRAAVDVPWGKTTRNGVEINFGGTDRDVKSGQSTLTEESFRVDDEVTVTANLLYTDLLNVAEALGVITGAVTGDLSVPTAEVLELAFNGAAGAREDKIYIVHPGPKSTRRYEFARMKVQPGVRIGVTAEQEQVLTVTMKLLNPKDAAVPVTITDAI